MGSVVDFIVLVWLFPINLLYGDAAGKYTSAFWQIVPIYY